MLITIVVALSYRRGGARRAAAGEAALAPAPAPAGSSPDEGTPATAE
jgi:hypothetical protein